MKVSTRARYGTRAMLDVALHCGEGPVHLKDIARRQQLSRKYLEHLTSRLQAAGLLRSIRGTRARTNLGRPPSEIRLSEIFQILEGPIALLECVDSPERCPRSSTCATRDVWTQMGQLMRAFLESKTLEDLCRQQREKERPARAMYHI
jgi:Rrf2 family protein